MTGRGLALLLGTAALAWALLGTGAPGLGIPQRDGVALLALAAAVLWLTGWAVERARPTWRETLGAGLMWLVFVATATAVYVHREAAIESLGRVAEEAGFGPPVTVVTGAGEVAVMRRRDGTFVVPAGVNGRPFTFLFDTGASSVVLTEETARALGFTPDTLRYRVPVLTANGRTMAAPVTIERLAIGPIEMTRVPALVTAAGLLHENLLGQSVLTRLESYEVRGNRLVLRAAKG